MDDKILKKILAKASDEQKEIIKDILTKEYANHFANLFNLLKSTGEKSRRGGAILKLTPYVYKKSARP